MKVIKFGMIEADGRFLRISECVKEMIVADIEVSNCFPASMQNILEEQKVISGGCTLTIKGFEFDGACVLNGDPKVEENKKPGWWLISIEDAEKINSKWIDFLSNNVVDASALSVIEEVRYIMDASLRSTDAVPDDFKDGKISDIKFDVDVANEIVNRIMDIFEKQNDTLTSIGEQIKLVNFGLTRVRNDIGGVTKKKIINNLKKEYQLLRTRVVNIVAMHSSEKISTGVLRNGLKYAFNQFEKQFDLSKE